MNISYKWLLELVSTTLAPGELAERLTMVGLAVDAVHEVGDDYVLEFDITSNRPDCLSHLGVAREVAVVTNGSVHLPEGEPTSDEKSQSATKSRENAKGDVSVEVRDLSLCLRYAARVIRGVRIAPSPDWMVKRLQAIGQRPINNVTDITNYVLFEQGQPLHAFDFAKLTEQRIVVRLAFEGERLRTLDGVARELNPQMLVIADAVRPVAVAGVMGGEESEISSATTDVLIESAYFEPHQVRRTAQALSLHTDASHRFERGVDFEGVLRAQARAVELIRDIAGGVAEDAIDVYPEPIKRRVVRLRFKRIKDLTSLDVASEESRRILIALGFVPQERGTLEAANQSFSHDVKKNELVQEAEINPIQEALFVTPTWRADIEREEDLVEEVARHVGYGKVEAKLPASSVSGEHQSHEGRRRAARRALAGSGFDEAISFSFIDSSHDERFAFVHDLAEGNDDSGNADRLVSLSNPIIEGVVRMRPTLLPGLLDAVRGNFNHGTRNVRLFEMGHVFARNAAAEGLPKEPEALALVATGGAMEEGCAAASRESDFFDLKGALEAVADAINIGPLEFEAHQVKHLREGQAAQVLIEGRLIGLCGRLSDEVAAGYKFRQAVYVAEVDLGRLLEAKERVVRYTPLARYPSIVRDLTLIANRRITFGELRRAALGLQIEECRSVQLIDVYEGGNVPEGNRSLTLRIKYQSDAGTLRDEEVDEKHARIVSRLEAVSADNNAK